MSVLNFSTLKRSYVGINTRSRTGATPTVEAMACHARAAAALLRGDEADFVASSTTVSHAVGGALADARRANVGALEEVGIVVKGD